MTLNTHDLKYIDELLTRGHWFIAGEFLMKYLSRLSPYGDGGLNTFWEQIREQENAKNKSIRLAFKAIQDEFFAVYGVMDADMLENFIRGKIENLRPLGEFKDSTGKKIRLNMTSSQIIKRWMELQDITLLPTFKYTMHFTDEMMKAVTQSITADELRIAGWMLREFYPGHMTGKYDGISIDKKYGQIYNVYLTSLLGFSDEKIVCYRTPYDICCSYVEVEDGEEEWEIDDNFDSFVGEDNQEDDDNDGDEPVCDKDIVLPRIIKSYERIGARGHIKLIKPLKPIGAYESIQKYIIEMENFKAFSQLRRDANSVFGGNNTNTVRKAIRQYHGSQVLALLDRFLDSFLMSGSIESQRYKGDYLLCKNWQ